MSIKSFYPTKASQFPDEYPLSYFAGTEPFATWLRLSRLIKPSISGKSKKKKPQLPPTTTVLPEWMNHVYLTKFVSRVIPKGLFVGYYVYLVEFTTTTEIAIALPQPKGTVALFGKPVKQGQPPDRLRLRFIIEPKLGHLVRLDISGAIRFQLPRGLVRPVVEHNHRWVDAQTSHIVVPLSHSTLSLSPGLPPRLSAPLTAPAAIVRVGQTGLVAKLNFARVDITGTAEKPKIRFQNIRLVHLA